MEKLTINDYKKMPWKNGQGITYEIARDKGKTLEDFGYRISMADVTSDGMFSHFLGKQRILTVLAGNGVILTVNEQEKVTLISQQIFKFSGESNVRSQLIHGSIRDLNVIFDPNAINANLTWLGQDEHLNTVADTIFLLANVNNTQGLINDQLFKLNQFDTLKIKNKTTNILLKKGGIAVIEIIQR